VRTSDFKSNEYADLLGGERFEEREANPMLGWRGASRYLDPAYRPAFDLECRAIRRVRKEVGLNNLAVMIPFCRTPEEADGVLQALAENGLVRGKDGLEVHVMAELPSNIVLAEDFAQRFDGFSIGTNDLTQLVLGVDRDSEKLSHLFDARHPAVKAMVEDLVEKAHAAGASVGICGDAPSVHPEFADFLVDLGIDSISVNPDSVLSLWQHLGQDS
jgi:pyruvate,water dikinase